MLSSARVATSGGRGEIAACGRRLDHHDADRMGNDVMEFASNPGAFSIDLLLGDQGMFAFGSFCALDQAVSPLAPTLQVVAEHEGRHEDDGRTDE